MSNLPDLAARPTIELLKYFFSSDPRAHLLKLSSTLAIPPTQSRHSYFLYVARTKSPSVPLEKKNTFPALT